MLETAENVSSDLHAGYTRGKVRETGRAFEAPAGRVWTLKDGKAGKLRAYVDTPKLFDALES